MTTQNTETKETIETRMVSLFGDEGGELRLAQDPATPNRFVGLIPFDALSSDLGGWKERIKPGAFKTTVTAGHDVRALVGHDPAMLLGRTANGTLRVAETPKGLAVEIDMPDTSYAKDIRALVSRRDIRGLSFGFKVREGGQRFTKEGGQTVRDLVDVDLKEVSIVANPAYGDSSVSVRSAQVDPTVATQIAALEKTPKREMAKRRYALHTIQ